MANTETWGQYLNITSTSTSQISVSWSSMGVSGNIVTSGYNIELYEGSESSANRVASDYGMSQSTRTKTFYNLKPGTHYLVKLYADRQNDRAVDRHWVSTLQPSNPVPGTPTLSLSSSGTTIYISGSVGADTTNLRVEVNGSLLRNIYTVGASSYSTTYTGAAYNTTYSIKVTPSNSWHTGSSVSKSITTSNVPTPPAPSGFRVYDSGESWASFTWNAASSATSYSLEIWRGSSLAVPAHYGITGTTRTVSGLSPGISYMAKLYAVNAGGSGDAVTFWFELGYDRPGNFGWTNTKARGLNYNIVNDRFTNLISYDEFTAIRQRINDFRRYKRLTAYTFTNVSRGAVFTAALYNELNDAIADMSPPTSTPGRKSSGTSNMPALLNGLVSALNSIK